MAHIYLGIGSNMGDPAQNIAAAYQMLSPAVRVTERSLFYETEPWGYKEQNNFVNAVWGAETQLAPQDLLFFLKEIERRIGREKNFRNGPRLIDLDILLYGDMVYHSSNLHIPHKEMLSRRFVLQPLCDLIPDSCHPENGRVWRQLLEEAPNDRIVPLQEQIDLSRTVFRPGLRPYLMGIINLTPDSFSGDGIDPSHSDYLRLAVEQASDFIQQGADMIDIGAESTRPGAQLLPEDVELQRLIPAIQQIRFFLPQALISVDTSKVAVARAAMESGANWINDVTGGNDPDMLDLAASAGCNIILMRSKSLLRVQEDCISEDKLIERVRCQLIDLSDRALRSGVKRRQIILDPGIGFGTTMMQNVMMIRRLTEIKEIGFPLLVGPSRKSFIGEFFQKPVTSRLAGTAAVSALAQCRGADIIRVHDVAFLSDLCRMSSILQ